MMTMIRSFLAVIFGLCCFLSGVMMPNLINKKWDFDEIFSYPIVLFFGLASLIGLILL